MRVGFSKGEANIALRCYGILTSMQIDEIAVSAHYWSSGQRFRQQQWSDLFDTSSPDVVVSEIVFHHMAEIVPCLSEVNDFGEY